MSEPQFMTDLWCV